MQITPYSVILTIHSILRWFVLLAGLFAIIRAITGLSFRRGYMGMDKRADMWFTILLDIQVLAGIILYILSPYTKPFIAAMTDPNKQFIAAIHVGVMLLAVIVAHVGVSMARKAQRAADKHRRILISFLSALVLVLLAIPWPFLPWGAGRGLF